MTEPQPPERKPVAVVPIQQQRPEPPSHLSPDEAQIWRDTVRSMRRDWFLEEPSRMLLRAYCVQCVLAADIEARLRSLRRQCKGRDKGSICDDASYRELVIAHVDACKTLLRLATVLRLTPLSNRQSIRDARTATPRPWPWEQR